MTRSCVSSKHHLSSVLSLLRSSDHNEQALMLSSAIELWSDDLRGCVQWHTHTFIWPHLIYLSHPVPIRITHARFERMFFWKLPTVEQRTSKNTWQSECSKCSCIFVVSNFSTGQRSFTAAFMLTLSYVWCQYFFSVLLLLRSSDHNEQALMLSAIELWSGDLSAMTCTLVTFHRCTWKLVCLIYLSRPAPAESPHVVFGWWSD